MSAPVWIQLILTVITFLAVLVALFGERLWKQWERPVISVQFDPSSDRCLRYAISNREVIQEDGEIHNVERYYFRLNVANVGRSTAHNVRLRADLFDHNMKPVAGFEPSTLRWISNTSSVELAQGESEYVNLLSQLLNHPSVKNRIHIDLSHLHLRAIAWDRPLTTYNIKIVIHADNITPITKWLRYTPHKDSAKPGRLDLV